MKFCHIISIKYHFSYQLSHLLFDAFQPIGIIIYFCNPYHSKGPYLFCNKFNLLKIYLNILIYTKYLFPVYLNIFQSESIRD